ncbi:hypothetical protein Ahy_B06g084503 [Arachis hypogaea]|uniref:Uncharacterized protein n=1 Tax=Arachis hypogaea TaxID=3818 RepID=A0A444YS39_ARAHY|nr:hypothetical protein Ahy_B06g084503 [Arachis hypogaea]
MFSVTRRDPGGARDSQYGGRTTTSSMIFLPFYVCFLSVHRRWSRTATDQIGGNNFRRPTLLRIANGVGGLGYKYEAKFSIYFCTSQKHFKLIFALRECGCTGVPVLERNKSMCCNNFHIVIFSGCHLTTAVVFSPYTIATMSGYSSAVKLEIEKFDGRINFGLWQIQVKDVLIQSGLHKALKEKISGCSL